MSLLAVASSSWKESMRNKGGEGTFEPHVSSSSNHPPPPRPPLAPAKPPLDTVLSRLCLVGITLPYPLHMDQYSLDMLQSKGEWLLSNPRVSLSGSAPTDSGDFPVLSISGYGQEQKALHVSEPSPVLLHLLLQGGGRRTRGFSFSNRKSTNSCIAHWPEYCFLTWKQWESDLASLDIILPLYGHPVPTAKEEVRITRNNQS